MKHIHLLVIFFLEYWLIAQNPARIVGRVRTESAEEIEFVSVYIASTTIGTSTDQNGSYQLDNLPSGQIKIVFQCVGFQKQMVEKIIYSDSTYIVDITLYEDVFQAGTEIVKAERDWKWLRQMNIVKQELFGYSDFSSDCELINPEVLNLREEDGYVVGFSEQSLEIINNALGYKLIFDIDTLRVKPHELFSDGDIRFEKLDAADDSETETWDENRLLVYNGSFKHFLASLYADKLDENRFSVLHYNRYPTFESLAGDEISSKNLVSSSGNEFKSLYFSGYLQIIQSVIPRGDFLSYYRKTLFYNQFQVISFINSDHEILFDRNGNTIHVDGLAGFEQRGFFGFFSLAGLLPEDYQPVTH